MRPNITDVPVNKQTAIVAGPGKKEGFIFKRNAVRSSMVPLPMREFTGPKENDLTGLKVDRLTVVGLSVFKATGTGSKCLWVVRCSCGRYEVMRTRALKRNGPRYKAALASGVSKVFSCHECDRTIQTRDGKRIRP